MNQSLAPPRIVHAFGGQGDLSLSAAWRAADRLPGLRDSLAEVFTRIDPVARELELPPLRTRLLGAEPPPARWLAEQAPGAAQLALFGISLAVHRARLAEGAVPSLLLAVSFGEIPALTAAGSFSVPDGARLAARLGVLLHTAPGGLTMLAAAPDKLAELLDHAPEIVVACVNHPEETVVSAPPGPLAAFEAAARSAGLSATRLQLPFIAHHPALWRQADAFERFAAGLPHRPPALPVHSAVAGRAYHAAAELPRGLADCLVRPALLPPLVRAAVRPGDLVVEMGTGQALARAVLHIEPAARALTPVGDAARRPDPPVPAGRPHEEHG
ncbi:acyltransferase domain-containing protein [Kitasatospora sp. NPDC008050]|uniref:acyltransferase domain-containing protein n=1 Tax=Kitasatospora sp. NPDC008050 TaxID=3364021 RepID=UPI0036E426D9